MYGENTKNIAIPIYRVVLYPVIYIGYGMVLLANENINGAVYNSTHLHAHIL